MEQDSDELSGLSITGEDSLDRASGLYLLIES